MLNHAARNSPYFRERYRGIDVQRCALSDLPTTSKADLMAHFDQAVTDPHVTRAGVERFIDDPANLGRLYLNKYPVCHTSGSQGQPFLVVMDPQSLELLFAFQSTRGNVAFRIGPLEAIRRLVHPARLAAIASQHGFYPSATAWQHVPPALKLFTKLRLFASTDPDLIPKLNEYNPTHLTGYPSVLELLALQRNRFHLPDLKQIVTTSEMLSESARNRIRDSFGVPVLNNYAIAECLFISTGCHTHTGAHINADWSIFEVVDEHNRPVPPGQPGKKVLITNLANFVQPIIRYEVGDRAVMATTPCACGNPLPRLERIDGRSAEVFWVEDEGHYRVLSVYPFMITFLNLRSLREWRVTQEGRNRILVQLEPLPGEAIDLNRVRQDLETQMEAFGLSGILQITIKTVAQLPPDSQNGKFQRMVSLVGPPADMKHAASLTPADRETSSVSRGFENAR